MKTIIILVSLLVAAPLANVHCITNLLDEGFEAYTVGEQVPDTDTNWSYVLDCPSDNGLVADTQAYDTKSVHFDFGDTDRGMIRWTADDGGTIAKGVIEFSFYFDSSEANQWLFFIQGAKDETGTRIDMLQLRFSSASGIWDYPLGYSNEDYHWLDDISQDTWHYVKIRFDHFLYKYDLYFDGELMGDDVSYYAGDTGYATSDISLGDGSKLTNKNLDVYLDEVFLDVNHAYIPPKLLDEDFEAYTVGEQVPDTNTNWSYENCPEDNGLVADTQAYDTQSVHFDFDQDTETGKIKWTVNDGDTMAKGVITFNFYFDSSETSQWLFFRQVARSGGDDLIMLELRFSNNYGIYDYPEGYSDSDYHWLESGIAQDTWHSVKIKFDHARYYYDLYVDDVLLDTGIAYYRGDRTYETRYIVLGDQRAVSGYNLNAYLDNISISNASAYVSDGEITPRGLEVLCKLYTYEGQTHDILYRHNVGDTWQEAITVTSCDSAGVYPFSTPNFGSQLFNAEDGGDTTVYGSSYQIAQFYELNLDTRESTCHGNPFVSGGQLYSILPYSSTKIYFVSYPHSDIITYDPTQPWDTGDDDKADTSGTNPLYIGEIGDEQTRPEDIILGPDGYVYIVNVPEYGIVGGALTKLNPTTDTWTNYRNIVDTQSLVTICNIAGNDTLIAGGTSGRVTGYSESIGPAKLFLWDTSLDTVVYEAKPPLGEDVYEVGQLESTSDGILVGLCRLEGNQKLYFFAFDPATETFIDTKDITSTVGVGYIQGQMTEPYNGYIYFTTRAGKICSIDTSTYDVSVATTIETATKGGGLVRDPQNNDEMTYLVMADAELLGVSLDSPYDFVNYGITVDKPYSAKVVYGPGENGVVDTIYMVCNNFYDYWFFVALNTTTGDTIQYIAPDGNQPRYGACIGHDRKLYTVTARDASLYVFDPDNPDSGIQDLGEVCEDETYLFGLCNGPDGRLYMGSFPNGKLVCYDIENDTFIDYGRVVDDEMYTRYVAPYSDTYAYARVGPIDRRLMRVNMVTDARDTVTLPEDFDNFYLFLGSDGEVYCTQGDSMIVIEGLSYSNVSTVPDDNYGVMTIPGIELEYDFLNQEITYSRPYYTGVLWIDTGDTARTDPRDLTNYQRYYTIDEN
jgi:hypothetical protein